MSDIFMPYEKMCMLSASLNNLKYQFACSSIVSLPDYYQTLQSLGSFDYSTGSTTWRPHAIFSPLLAYAFFSPIPLQPKFSDAVLTPARALAFF
jgi:hypothetical protein